MNDFFRRVYYLLNRRRLEQELQNDIDVHREMLPPDARKDFGNPTLARERSREAWGWGWLDRLCQDVRFGSRLLKKSPGLAVTAIVVLALGIGVNVTAFNIIDVAFFKPLPVRDPHSLVRFTSQFQDGTSTEVPYPAAEFYREHNHVLSSVIVQRWTNMTLSQQTTESVRAGMVSANYFSELGTRAAYGRLFSPDDNAHAAPVAVLAYSFWQTHFGGDASVIGKTVWLNQRVASIIGVTPYEFTGLNPEDDHRNDVWLLVKQETYFVPQSEVLTSFDATASRVHMWGRLQPGISIRAAELALLPLAQELAREHPDVLDKDEHLKASPGAYAISLRASDLPLFALLSTLVLLILATTCGNLGNLLLGRAAAREREIATRLALGATRSRIVRQLLTEGMLLAAAGSVAALCLSWYASRALIVMLGGPGNFDFSPDWRTVMFAFGAGVAACLLAGLPPAWRLVRQKHGPSPARTAFLVTQVVASCVLLVVSALLVRAMQRALRSDPGFDYAQTVTVDPALYAHALQPAASRQLLERLQERIKQVPGVESVTLVSCPPMGNRAWMQRVRGSVKLDVYINEVTPGFFQTMGIPLLRGRDFTRDDHDVVVVSESYARKVWPGKDPLQQKYDLGTAQLPVIGVARNARAVDMHNGEAAEMYRPMQDKTFSEAVVLLRANRRPEDVVGPVGEVASSIDPVLSPEVEPVKRAFEQKVGLSAKVAGIIGGMGTLALLLAMVGLYGVVSYNVLQKTREIGIRMALGANSFRVVHSVVYRLILPLGSALAVGLALAAAASVVMRSQLYGLNSFDPLSYLTGAILLTGVGIAAVLIPAQRALKVDPMVALRCE
jgi:predicted permease